MPASLDFTAPKLGSGARFRKLSSALAARGAADPDALAAWIGQRKYGAKRMGRLSHHAHANPDLGIYLAVTARDEQDLTLTCPECDYSGPASSFGASGASLDKSPDDLRTPAPSTSGTRDGVPVTVSSKTSPHALASTRQALELAAGTLTARRYPVKEPADVIVARGEDGQAVIRHRHGGSQIAAIRKDDAGRWVATVNGRDLAPHARQRTALMDAVGTWNKAVSGIARPAAAPLQPAPEQTPLMAQYGIPAIRALATPAASAGGGPRVTMAAASGSGDDGTDENGLNAKGQGIYKRLIARGMKPGTAMAFARRSQNAKPGVFGKAGS